MNGRIVLGIILIGIGLSGMVLLPLYTIGSFRGYLSDMGWRLQPQSQRASMTIEQAEYISRQFLDSLNLPDLDVKEIMEFENNFYIIYYEKSTGLGAFEMLIWKTSPNAGQIMPEPGPNMMWNTKYGGMMGHMGGFMGGMMGGRYRGEATADMPIDEDEARRIGQEYLDEYMPGAVIMESTKFYGYYTFDFGKDGKIIGMFSVNGYNGQVWYHGWHGAFITMEEYGEGHEE